MIKERNKLNKWKDKQNFNKNKTLNVKKKMIKKHRKEILELEYTYKKNSNYKQNLNFMRKRLKY